jgi:hypothetical protein
LSSFVDTRRSKEELENFTNGHSGRETMRVVFPLLGSDYSVADEDKDYYLFIGIILPITVLRV